MILLGFSNRYNLYLIMSNLRNQGHSVSYRLIKIVTLFKNDPNIFVVNSFVELNSEGEIVSGALLLASRTSIIGRLLKILKVSF